MALVSAGLAAFDDAQVQVGYTYDDVSLQIQSIDLRSAGSLSVVHVTLILPLGLQAISWDRILDTDQSIDVRSLDLVLTAGAGKDGQAGGLALPCLIDVGWSAT